MAELLTCIIIKKKRLSSTQANDEPFPGKHLIEKGGIKRRYPKWDS